MRPSDGTTVLEEIDVMGEVRTSGRNRGPRTRPVSTPWTLSPNIPTETPRTSYKRLGLGLEPRQVRWETPRSLPRK